MCTVSWLQQPDGYVLFCNRDERHTRRPASGPRVSSVRGVSFLAPVDGDHGGSWIGANQFGLTLSLLNRNGDGSVEPRRTYISRGLLLTDLFDCRHGADVPVRLNDADLAAFRPFTMLALSTDEAPIVIDWDGHECAIDLQAEARLPLTSSSLRDPNIPELRRKLFAAMSLHRGNIDADVLRAFHQSHSPERGAASVCMHRDDAATVSLSIVTVRRDELEFVYHPSAPCVAADTETVVLGRAMSDRL